MIRTIFVHLADNNIWTWWATDEEEPNTFLDVDKYFFAEFDEDQDPFDLCKALNRGLIFNEIKRQMKSVQ